MDEPQPSQRTPLELVIKTLTTHVVTTANYVYLCSLQQRQRKGVLDVARVLFFVFVPPLLFIELFHSYFLALLQFVKNQADKDEVNISYHASMALGVNATTKTSDDATKNDYTKIPLATLSEDLVSQTKSPRDWGWGGKMLIAVFTLAQGIGTVVLWGRRLEHTFGNCFLFDHRNGLMGIASTIISLSTLTILLMRNKWSVNQELPPRFESSHNHSRRDLLIKIIVSYVVDSLIVHAHVEASYWNRQIGPDTWGMLIAGLDHVEVAPPTVILIIFLIIFRKEVAARIGIQVALARLTERVRPKTRRRLKLLVAAIIVIYIISSLLATFIFSVWEVVDHNDAASDYGDFWWQDPISETLLVI